MQHLETTLDELYDIGNYIDTYALGHYARVLDYEHDEVETALTVKRGSGFDCGRDGLVYKNVFASFCHVHALGEKGWAKALVDAAQGRMGQKKAASKAEAEVRLQNKH